MFSKALYTLPLVGLWRNQSRSLCSVSRNRRANPRSKAFAQCLRDHGILIGSDRICSNSKDLQRVLRPTTLPSHIKLPSQYDFKQFKDTSQLNESHIKRTLLPILIGGDRERFENPPEFHYTNFETMTEGQTSKPVPDYFEGSSPNHLTRQLKEDLGGILIPSKNAACPVVPNFFVEFKSSNGSTEVGKLQLAHTGAHGARAMHALQRFGKASPDGKCHTLSWLYHDGTLRLYGHFVLYSEDGQSGPLYHMEQIDGWHMWASFHEFCRAVFAFRESQGIARRDREGSIRVANLSVAASRAAPSRKLT